MLLSCSNTVLSWCVRPPALPASLVMLCGCGSRECYCVGSIFCGFAPVWNEHVVCSVELVSNVRKEGRQVTQTYCCDTPRPSCGMWPYVTCTAAVSSHTAAVNAPLLLVIVHVQAVVGSCERSISLYTTQACVVISG